jgi:hypothetical protein
MKSVSGQFSTGLKYIAGPRAYQPGAAKRHMYGARTQPSTSVFLRRPRSVAA